MTRLEKFNVKTGVGSILMRDPRHICFELNPALAEVHKAHAIEVLSDFADTLQYLSNWMLKTKALS
jgi:hypothetical protein